MKLLEVNTVAVGGSIPAYIGTIVDEAGRRGIDVTVAKGRRGDRAGVDNLTIGTRLDTAVHGLATRLLDRHGLASKRATGRFCDRIEALAPDVIHLHNIHGYYLHFPTLMRRLAAMDTPVYWSLHDCWAFTGHCPVFSWPGGCCDGWRRGCGSCPLRGYYPVSWGADRSAANLRAKAEAFTSVPRLTLLPVSEWLDSLLGDSVLAPVPRKVVKIDLDTDTFKPTGEPSRLRVLGVAAVWNPLKGLDFFKRLRRVLPEEVEIRLVGGFRGKAPEGMDMAGTVSSRSDMAREYSEATVLVNPTYADNLPMVNREALACGCPVVTRLTGGTVEGLDVPGVPIYYGTTDEQLIAGVLQALTLGSDARARAAAHLQQMYGSRPGLARLFSLFGM